MDYCVIDLETTTKTVHKRTANPWFNSIVAGSLKTLNFSRTFIESDCNKICQLIPSPTKILVGHNIKFDLLYLWGSERLQEALKEGLTIWDTQLAEYYLTAQQHKYAALRDIATKKYKCSVREKLMEPYWEKGIDTKDIPIDLVIEDVEADVRDTEAIYLQQIEKAKQLGMYEIIQLKMEALLATTEMEWNGLYIDQNILQTNEALLGTKIQILEQELQDLIKPYWKLEPLNLNSAKQLSILLFGGKVSIESRAPVLDMHGLPTLIKTGPNKGDIKMGKRTIERQEPGLKLTPQAAWKGAKDGQYSTKEEVLEIIALGDPSHIAVKFVKKLLDLRKLTRELNTNYIGLKELLYKTNCIHPLFSHCGYGERDELNSGGTETGRLSCTKPNVQNAPKANVSTVRQYFVSRRLSGGVLLEGDFSQIEPITQAQISGDPQYIKDMIDGIDTHVKRLSMKEKMEYLQCFKLCKVDKDPVWVDKRSKIKEFSFQRTYGAGASKIALNTGLRVEEIKEMIKNEDLDYHILKQYNDMLMDHVKQTAKPTEKKTKLGYTVYEGWYKNPFGSRYSFLTDDAPEWMAKTTPTTFKPTKVKNYIVQGTAFDLLAIYLGLVFRESIKHRDKFLLVNTVHDSVVLDCNKENVEFACNLLKNQVQLLNEIIKIKLKYDWVVPIKMEFKSGKSWYECGV